jgi:hypothetical protein
MRDGASSEWEQELDRVAWSAEPATERERQIRDRALRAVVEMWRQRSPGSVAAFGFDLLEHLGIGPVGQPGIPYLIATSDVGHLASDVRAIWSEANAIAAAIRTAKRSAERQALLQQVFGGDDFSLVH